MRTDQIVLISRCWELDMGSTSILSFVKNFPAKGVNANDKKLDLNGRY